MVERLYFVLSLVIIISAEGSDLATKVPNIDGNNEFPMPDDITTLRVPASSNASTKEESLEKNSNGPKFEKVQEVKKDLCSLSIKHGDMVGVIMSPNYPGTYPNNITCLWKVRAPPEHLMYISFKNFRLEAGVKIASSCPFDYLYIMEEFTVKRPASPRYHSQDIRYQRSMGTYCGDSVPENLQSRKRGSSVYFYFHSDESKMEKGFILSYRFLKLDNLATHATTLDMWKDEDSELGLPSMEEEFLKIFSCVVFVFVFFIVLLGTLYKCWKSTSDQLDADGHAHHSCCCGAIRLDVVAGGSRNQGSRLNPCDSSPRLPTPPPEYGEVVKTEEDWNRVIQQLGEASATALRQRLATEELQVTYDLGDSERIDVFTTTSSVNTSSFTDSASMSIGEVDRPPYTSPADTDQGHAGPQPSISLEVIEEEISSGQLV